MKKRILSIIIIILMILSCGDDNLMSTLEKNRILIEGQNIVVKNKSCLENNSLAVYEGTNCIIKVKLKKKPVSTFDMYIKSNNQKVILINKNKISFNEHDYNKYKEIEITALKQKLSENKYHANIIFNLFKNIEEFKISLKQPQLNIVAISGNKIKVRWPRITGASSYIIYWKENSQDNLSISFSKEINEYTFQNLNFLSTYSFWGKIKNKSIPSFESPVEIAFNHSVLFVDKNGKLEGSVNGSVKFGDIDGDGDLDLIITGSDSHGNPVTSLYINTLK